MARKMKKIGILGGMGPEAVAELYMGIFRIFQQEYGARLDADFPEIIIISKPIPDVVENLEKPEQILSELIRAINQLETAGADFIVIACNTVHCFIEILRKKSKIPILSIMEEVAAQLRDTTVGLLATEATIKKAVFDRDLNKKGVILIKPDTEQQKIVTTIILNILGGKKIESDKKKLVAIITQMKQKGARSVILGCTDLPCLFEESESPIPLIDTTKVLAASAVRTCLGK